MLNACMGDSNINKTQLGIGVVQLLTSVYLIGWVSSIYWGYLIIKKSKGDHNDIKNLINAASGAAASASDNGRQSAPTSGQRRPNNPYEDDQI